MTDESKERQVLQLLRDYRGFYSAFGGAMPLDDTYVKDASYGPAGMVVTGAEYDKFQREKLTETFAVLNVALRLLRRDHFPLWTSLIDPYLSDPADPGIVDNWRGRLSKLDSENGQIRVQNESNRRLRKRGKEAPADRMEKVGLVWTRTLLDRHDRAITKLAQYLRDVDLYHVPAKLMSTQEEADIEKQNAEIFAVFQRIRVSGYNERSAISQTAEHFRVSEGAVQRTVEFRSNIKLATCIEDGCKRPPERGNFCFKHYHQARREKSS